MRKIEFAILLMALLVPAACGGGAAKPVGADPAEPAFSASLFPADPARITNPWFPLRPGETRIYQRETEEGVETVVEEVQEATREVAAVACAVVRVREYLDDRIVEDARDWYAQDAEGNVWYLGEEVVNYEYDDEGELLGTDDDGSWEAGVDGAVAGILMKATLVPGDAYRQEFYEGEAEDMAEIVALDVPVTLEDGSAYLCLKTRDWNPLEEDSVEFKYYAPGVGLVAEEDEDGGERVELRGRFDQSPASLPSFDAAAFSAPSGITHPYAGFAVGAVREYRAETDEGTETILVESLAETRTVSGLVCRVVRDRVYLDGTLIEDTRDWYAQDDEGNVWYMGEEVVNYEYDDEGNLIGTNDDGSWEAGVEGAAPGILLWATPAPGRSYYQEFDEGEAEDMAVVVATGVTVVLADGTTFENVLQTLEWTPLEPEILEWKFHAPGIGVVLEAEAGDGERVELVPAP